LLHKLFPLSIDFSLSPCICEHMYCSPHWNKFSCLSDLLILSSTLIFSFFLMKVFQSIIYLFFLIWFLLPNLLQSGMNPGLQSLKSYIQKKDFD
jgi:hypothetical protein